MSLPKSILQEIKQSGVFNFLLLLICADIAFFILHILVTYAGVLEDFRMALEHDGGYAEFYQYIKEYWISILLAIASVRFRQVSLAIWSLLYGYFLLDDALLLHEKWGAAIGSHLGAGSFLHLRMQDYGELAVAMMILLIFLLLLLPSLRKCSHLCRRTNLDLAVLLLLLAFFGVFIDALHIFLSSLPGISFMTIIEDGGEMIILSITCSYAYHLLQDKREIPISIWSLVYQKPRE
jgi:hypothetical protein